MGSNTTVVVFFLPYPVIRNSKNRKMSSARNTAIVPWILSFIHATYQAVLLRLGLSSTPPQGIQEVLEEFTCASKLFKMNGKECLLCVYPDDKLVALCFLVVSSENAYMSKRNSNELEQDKMLIVKSPQLTPVQRWLLFFDNMSNAVQNSEFTCSSTQLVINCLGVQFKYPLVPEKHVTNYATLLFKMKKISNSMAEKITELQEKIFEQDEQLQEQDDSEGTDETYETDVPIQRVLHLLSSWRNGPLRRDSVNVDFVTRILKNNSLYSIAAQEEEDTEVKGWLANEIGCGSATTPTTHKTSTQNWGRVRAYSRVLNFTNALQYQIAKHQDIEYPEEIRLALQDVDSFDWDVFEMNKASFNRPLYFTALYLFEKHDLFHKCRINVQHFKNFMETMECGYKNNPYHNAIHATDVLQTVHALLTRSSKTSHLNDIEKFALLISAIVHDYEHPGVNNIFEKATETDRALLYNDQSILENHHCSQAFRVMNKPNCNILESLDKEQRKYFRETVISLVLATDITKHGEIKSDCCRRV